MTAILIRGGTVVNADRQLRADVLCVDGKIARVSEALEAPAGANFEAVHKRTETLKPTAVAR